MSVNTEYTADDIQVLSDREHVRLRTSVYLGNTSVCQYTLPVFEQDQLTAQTVNFVPAVYKAVGEILDNSVDELVQLNQSTKRICIEAQPKLGMYTISDNGRGVPIDKHPIGKRTPEVVFGHLRSGRNFSNDREAGIIGQNGVGSACTCYCSTEFTINIARDGKRYRQTFTDGGHHVTKPSITKGPNKTGTTISFQLDAEIFEDITLPDQLIRNRAKEIALTNPGLTVEYNGELFRYTKGFEQLLKQFSSQYFRFEHNGYQFFVVFDVHQGLDEQLFTWVNSSFLFDGGLCNTQFLNAFADRVINYTKKEANRQKCEVTKNDVRQNLLVIGNVQLSNPEYDSQAKTRLTGPSLRKELTELIDNNWSSFSRKHKQWLQTVLDRAAERHHRQADKKAVKEHQKKIGKKIPGLIDASSPNRFDCQLIVTEGDCLHEDTEIKTIDDTGIIDKHIKNIQVGDLVITHNSQIKPVVSKKALVKKGIKITHAHGTLIVSEDHRLYCYDPQKQSFAWLPAKEITPAHKLVRNKLGGWIASTPFTVQTINDGKFNYIIETAIENIKSTPSHKFVVFDVDQQRIVKVKACDLIPQKHFLILLRL